jgi:hypothetical protein
MTDYEGEVDDIAREQQLHQMLESLRRGKFDLKSGDKQIILAKSLGTGGTKTVYDAAIDNQHFALALPNTVDSVGIMESKWTIVMQEPHNTERVRILGINTNPVCETIDLSVNAIPFKGLRMMRYQDLPFQIIDGKNPSSSTIEQPLLPQQLTEHSFRSLFSGIQSDIAILIRNGVQLGADSFNLCVTDNGLRIYLNDLGSTEFSRFLPNELHDVCGTYIRTAISALINGLSETEFQKHKAFFEGNAFKLNNQNRISNIMSNTLYEELR